MGTNNQRVISEPPVNQERLRQLVRHQRIADAAVHRALEENRRMGLSNGHTTNGKIVSDIQLAEIANGKK